MSNQSMHNKTLSFDSQNNSFKDQEIIDHLIAHLRNSLHRQKQLMDQADSIIHSFQAQKELNQRKLFS